MRNIWDKLKVKWNIESDRRMAWIFIMFSITGSSVTLVRQPFTEAVFQKSTYGELYWYELLVTIILVYIVYQFFLFTIGTVMGEYKFVRWFIIKMNKRMLPFLKKIE
jgi:polyferredoxin